MLLIAGASISGAGLFIASVDLPPEPTTPKASLLLYSDGHTVLAQVGILNRVDVPLSQVPRDVRLAVLAAEDRGFYGHSGLSARAVVRAAVSNAAGNDLQGASTITQQYVKNAYLTRDRTMRRKATEAAMALRLEERLGKNDILERYLNTIYFGRGAYGIGAAARTYFGVPVDRLSLSQGAVLAAVIKDPWAFDPAENPGPARSRWRWVISAMAEEGWISPARAADSVYSNPVRPSADRLASQGAAGLIVDQVERELTTHGITPQLLRTGGLRVVTTIDHRAQQTAVEEIHRVLANQPDNLRAALVAIEPTTGAVRAHYGGDQGQGSFDFAGGARPPGTTFQPVVLAEALRQGISSRSRWDGSSPRTFRDRGGVPLYNPRNEQCRNCTLVQATAHSLHTPFYDVATRVGPENVAALGHDLGIAPIRHSSPTLVDLASEPAPGRTRADIAVGRYPIAPSDLATVYAVFAAEGMWHQRHVVRSVSSSENVFLLTATPAARRVLDSAVTADVTEALAATPGPALPGARPAVARTATVRWTDAGDSQDAWIAGYTPELATAIWIGPEMPGPIRDNAGRDIGGDTLPRDVWRAFVERSLQGVPGSSLQTPAHIGSVDIGRGAADGPEEPGRRSTGPTSGPTAQPGTAEPRSESTPSGSISPQPFDQPGPGASAPTR
jgi:membrane peptidoglycan carboxypeptidase